MTDTFENDQEKEGIDTENEQGEQSFAEMFESYSAGMSDDIQVGDKIKGEIISIGMDSIYIDTGSKIDGVVEKAELQNEDGELPVEVGDKVELYVVAMNESEIKLSKAISGVGGLNMLTDAYKNKVPVEGKVSATCKGGFNVEILKRRAFCPISQMDLKYVEDGEIYVGQTFNFMITRIEDRGKNIVVSRREILNREQEASKAEYFKSLKPGIAVEGKVTKLMPYGAFVELSPGIEGMVHISEISWSRIEKPEECLKANEKVMVKVLRIEEPENPSKPPKISLSIKQIQGDPWTSIDTDFSIGQSVVGKVMRCANFGAFVEIAPGVEGLVHISEMSYTKRILKADDVVSPGEEVTVVVKAIEPDKKRISLSIKDAEGDPWAEVSSKYEIGRPIEGTIEKREKFGYFVNLEPGVTGLLPKSKIDRSPDPAAIEKLKPGAAITVKVEEINARDRRLTLGIPGEETNDDWRRYSSNTESSGSDSAFGSLGEKLQQALKSKE